MDLNKRIFFTFLIFGISLFFTRSSVFAAYQFSEEWTQSAGGINNDDAKKIARDGQGNIFVGGAYGADFDSDPTGTIETHGQAGAFISKYSSDGTYIWTKTLLINTTVSPSGQVVITDVAADNDGGVYAVGYFRGLLDFDPGVGINYYMSAGGSSNSDGFIIKLNEDGEAQWSQRVGNTDDDSTSSVAVQGSTVYFGGSYSIGVIFDSGGTNDSRVSAGGQDGYIASYTTNGAFNWVHTFGGTENEGVYDIATTSDAVHAVGAYEDTVDFNPAGPAASATSLGNQDSFLLTLEPDGTFGWLRVWGSTALDRATTVAADSTGSVYVGGRFEGSIDFDPSGAEEIYTNDNGFILDAYLTKYSADSSYNWTHVLSGSDWEYIEAVTVDDQDRVFIVGGYGGTVEFGDESTSVSHTAEYLIDPFVALYDSEGDYLSSTVLKGETATELFTDAIVVNNKMYVLGSYTGIFADVDPSDNVLELESAGNTDYFLSKWSFEEIFNQEGPESGNKSNKQHITKSKKAKAPQCGEAKPIGSADLFQINRNGSQASLFFTPLNTKVTAYHVVYGYTVGEQRFGGLSLPVTTDSSTGVQNMIVKDLNPYLEYWFTIIPSNGCAVGDWSNWLKAGKSFSKEKIFYRY